MSVTIISDASYCHQTKAAGWAAWMKSDTKPSLLQSGQIGIKPDHAGEAELFAVANALFVAEREGFLVAGERLLIQSDSMWALAVIRAKIGVSDHPHRNGQGVPAKNKAKLTTPANEAVKLIARIIQDSKVVASVRHVKGHSKTGDGRSWVNNACDKAAKKQMRSARCNLKGAAE